MAAITVGDVFYATVRLGLHSKTIFGKQLAGCRLGPFTATKSDTTNIYAIDRVRARGMFTFTRENPNV